MWLLFVGGFLMFHIMDIDRHILCASQLELSQGDADTTYASRTLLGINTSKIVTPSYAGDVSIATESSTRPAIVGDVAKRDAAGKTMAELARENVLGMKSNSVRCSQPRPKVIKVQDYHPHAYKRYVPSCIVLHRCDRDTGCCDEQGAVCSILRRKKVTLYFYIVSLGSRNGVTGPESAGQIEALRFFNHTECICRRRRKPKSQTEKPRDLEISSLATVTSKESYCLVVTLLCLWSAGWCSL